MNIQLSKESRDIIDRQMQCGDYGSPDEVVEAAVQLLAAMRFADASAVDPMTGEPIDDDELRERIQEGMRDLANGHIAPLDVEDIMRRGRERRAERIGAQEA